MRKTNVVIASVLKPVDDTRMYEKFARTLARLPGFHIHIIGFYSTHQPSEENISFYPLFNFKRLSFFRFIASWKYYKYLIKLKPDIVIVNTTDLLIVTLIHKILFGSEILYDVQENYMYNSIYTEKFRRPLNYIIGYLLRIIEWIAAPFITHFILAEKTYEQELPFIGKRFTIIENKFVVPENTSSYSLDKYHNRSIYHLLYSGTIADSYGIFDAINLAVKLHHVDNRFHLTVIGFCADSRCFAKILKAVSGHPFIRIIGGNKLVPHSDILIAIQTAGLGLISYKANKSTANKMPTKLFEYMYFDLPILLPNNGLWRDFSERVNSGFVIDYEQVDSFSLVSKLLAYDFYSINQDKYLLTWSSIDSKLISLVEFIYTTKISKNELNN